MILTLTAHYRPNLGGLETHLTDLEQSLQKRKITNFVLTYKPLSTSADSRIWEKKPYLTILRIPWIAGFFYRLINLPVLEFLYLFPGLFFALPIVLLKLNITTVHAHGLVAGFVAVFWGRLFNKRVLISTHSIYNFPNSGAYFHLSRWIFSQADKVLCLSEQSIREIINLGINEANVVRFVYWIDTKSFKPLISDSLKPELGLTNKFVVLFVGRLIKEKGIVQLLNSVKKLNSKVEVLIVGDGPLRNLVEKKVRNTDKLRYLGKLNSEELPLYYNTADVLIVPSISQEGFGRIILESLACGTPVIGSKKGAISEAMDQTVGVLIDPEVQSIVQSIERLRKSPAILKKFKQNARQFALKRYSGKNAELIIKHYR